MSGVTFEILSKRLQRRIGAIDPKSQRMREALTRAGILVTNEAKVNATRQGIVDRGSLRRSINYELVDSGSVSGVIISPFGTRYAAIHEFGGPFTKLMRKAMFATLRDAGKLNKVATRKNVVVGRTFRARPYLGPALKSNADKVIKLIQSAVSNSISQPK